MSQTHPACIREAISQVLSRHGDGAEARRQPVHLAPLEITHCPTISRPRSRYAVSVMSRIFTTKRLKLGLMESGSSRPAVKVARWSTYDAVRAWSSPIWFTPRG